MVTTQVYTANERRPSRQTRALAVDDHRIILDAVTDALLSSSVVSAVDCALRLQDAQEMLARNADYDLVILDLNLDDAVGLDTLTELRESFPDVPVLVFSSTNSSDTMHLALEGGARGYVPKSSATEVLVYAVRLVLSGSVYVPPELLRLPKFVETRAAAQNASPLPQFSPRQADVCRLLLQGMPNKVIAKRLGMAEGTVKAHLSTVFRVLQVNNRAQAVLRAHQLGMI
jgi:DNA-binding NarL/FixJ family response regulator